MNYQDRVEIMGMDEDIAKVLANTSAHSLRKAQGTNMNIDFIQAMTAGFHDNRGNYMYTEDELKTGILMDSTKTKLIKQITEGDFALIHEPAGIDLYTQLGADVFKDFEGLPDKTPLPYELVTENIRFIRKGMSDQLIGYKEGFFFDKRELRQLEHIWKGLVSEMKQNVVIKSGSVHIGNFMSNVFILRAMGVPFSSIVLYYKEALANIPKLKKDKQMLSKLRVKRQGLVAMSGNQKTIDSIDKRIASMESDMAANPVSVMFDEGLVQSITDEILAEELMGSDLFKNKMADLFSSLKDKETNPTITKFLEGFGVGIESLAAMTKPEKETFIISFVNENIEKIGQSMQNDPSMMNIAKELYGSSGSSTGSAMAQVMQMSDYISRYALYKHMVDVGAGTDKAADLAMNAFVDYRKNLPSMIRTMSEYGFWPFATFSLRIQPLLYTLITEHPIRAIASTIFFAELGNVTDISFTDWNTFNSNLYNGLTYGTDLTPIELSSFVPAYYQDAASAL